MTQSEKDTLTALLTSKWDMQKNLQTFLETVKVTEEVKKPPTRTITQNSALHLWYTQKATQCKDAGVTFQMAVSKTIDLDMTPFAMKTIWKYLQKIALGKESTTELSKIEDIEYMVNHLNLYFAEKCNLPDIPFPSDEERQKEMLYGYKTKAGEMENYPEYTGAPTF